MLKNTAIIIWSILLATLPAPNLALAQESGVLEYRVKAAFLLNFGKFVDWPPTAFSKPNAPLVIGVAGKDPFRGDLERIVRDKQIKGHPLVVRPITAISELAGCHILFISAAENGRMKDVLQAAQGMPILTVSETDQFIKAGGMINFVMEEGSIRFEINDAAASQAGLRISSKLLALARPTERESLK